MDEIDSDKLMCGILVIVLLIFSIFSVGASIGEPDELDNGCIMHKNTVYCKETNE